MNRSRGDAAWPLVGALLLVAAAGHARAATLEVTSFADDLDQGPNGNCTLREAVIAAEGDLPVDACPPGNAADTIVLAAGTYRFALAPVPFPPSPTDGPEVGDLDIASELSIVGAGSDATTIDADGLDGVLSVGATGLVTVRGARITGGKWAPPSHHGGGVSNAGYLALEDVRLEGNIGEKTGGGLSNFGSATLVDSVVNDNQAECIFYCFGPSAVTYGGGIYNTGTLEIVRSRISGNRAHEGQAIENRLGGSISVSDSETDGNGTGVGSAVENLGTLVLERSTLAERGPALQNGGEFQGINCTISGARTPFYPSRYLASLVYAGESPTRFDACTIVGSPDQSDTPLVSAQGAANAISFRNTIVDGPCAITASPTTLGGNLESLGDTCGFTDPTDRPAVSDPVLGVLGAHGGFAMTHLLVPGGAAVDSAPAAACLPTDERGVPRPQDGDGMGEAECDRGAVEGVCTGPDGDGDGFPDECDRCPASPDPAQLDSDRDGIGDACDSCPTAPTNDGDADGVCDDIDNCFAESNPTQADGDGDGRGDSCDSCFDADGDGYPLHEPYDGCPQVALDCNDTDATIHPGAVEIPGDGIDDDCSPFTPCGGPQAAHAASGGHVATSPLDSTATYVLAALGVVTTSHLRRRRARDASRVTPRGAPERWLRT